MSNALLSDHEVMEALASTVVFGSALPTGYRVVFTEEFSADEHDSNRTVVTEELATGRFFKFYFRFNYGMSDFEIIGIPVTEVFPHTVSTVVYTEQKQERN